MTRLRLAPRSLRGPLGPPPSSPLSLLQVFSLSLSLPFQVRLVLFFVYLFFYFFIFSRLSHRLPLSRFKTHTHHVHRTPDASQPVSFFIHFFLSLNAKIKQCEALKHPPLCKDAFIFPHCQCISKRPTVEGMSLVLKWGRGEKDSCAALLLSQLMKDLPSRTSVKWSGPVCHPARDTNNTLP